MILQFERIKIKIFLYSFFFFGINFSFIFLIGSFIAVRFVSFYQILNQKYHEKKNVERGFEVEIEEKIPNFHLCTFCKEILIDPYECSKKEKDGCEKMFCKDCLKTEKCSICGGKFEPNEKIEIIIKKKVQSKVSQMQKNDDFGRIQITSSIRMFHERL